MTTKLTKTQYAAITDHAARLWTRLEGNWAQNVAGQTVYLWAPDAYTYSRAGAILKAIETVTGKGTSTSRQFTTVEKRLIAMGARPMPTARTVTTPEGEVTFTLGERLIVELRSPWSGDYGRSRGVEVCTFVVEVIALKPGGFDYKSVERLRVLDPMPGTEGRQTYGGGMTYGYAYELELAGRLMRIRPYVADRGFVTVQ